MAYRVAQAIVVALLASQASAQFVGLPACAEGCVDTGAGPVGCTGTDLQCLCGSRRFLSSVQQCIGQACDPDSVASAQQIITNACDSTTGTGTSTGTFSGTRSDSISLSLSFTPSVPVTTPTTSTSITLPSTPLTTFRTQTTTSLTLPTTLDTTTSVTTNTNTNTNTGTGTTVPPLSTLSSFRPTSGLTSQTPGSPVQTGSGNNGALVVSAPSFLHTMWLGIAGLAWLAF
ncbi:hypothetical protein L218DRAFT_1001222 [Marasmius fiardii PR-910]|nr:hypothetical protein L218DRAFT_1001222 [Marasmius fiardii PR-910]